MSDIIAVKKLFARKLLGTNSGRNVVAVGIGNKMTDSSNVFGQVKSHDTGIRAVRLYVKNKLTSDDIGMSVKFDKEYAGVPIDVIEVTGEFRSHPGFGRRAGAEAGTSFGRGASIGPFLKDLSSRPNVNPVMAGTLGAFVVDEKKTAYILSCNHVLSGNGRIPRGTEIHSPAPADHAHGRGTPIAQLTAAVRLKEDDDNFVDCALAKADGGASKELSYWKEEEIRKSLLGKEVVKKGKSTDETTGRIIDVAADVIVDFSFGSFRFCDQILIEPVGNPQFASDGDSGAVVFTKDEKAVGLLFAPAGGLTVACPIHKVLSDLGQEVGAKLMLADRLETNAVHGERHESYTRSKRQRQPSPHPIHVSV